MHRRFLHRHSVTLAVVGLILSSLLVGLTVGAQETTSKRGRKYKMPPPSARIEVTVLRDSSGKPIQNASVIFHAVENGHAKGNMELKTNEDGKTVIDVFPKGGTMRVQIIAKGFQTYGDDYEIDKDQMAIEVRMKRPGEQYSIYKPHPEASEGGKDSDAPKSADKPAPPAPAPTDKPAAPPSQTQPK
jgi:5-hydroxyisourate hydrolase-like protein (transthyretin family)